MTIGTVVLIAALVILLSARTTPFAMAAVMLAVLVSASRNGLWPRLDTTGRWDWLPPLGVLVFLGYALVSTSWAHSPIMGLQHVLLGIVLALSAAGIAFIVRREPDLSAKHMAEGIWIGTLAGLVFLLVEILTNQSIKLFLFNLLDLPQEILKPYRSYSWRGDELVWIDNVLMTRNIAPVTLLLWPALLAALSTVARPYNRLLFIAVLLLAGCVTMLGPHETSALAFLAGLLAFLVARVSVRASVILLGTAWVAGCLLFIVLAPLAHKLDLHNASWLPKSAQHRIIIWDLTAEMTTQSPVFGIGARSTYTLGPELRDTFEDEPGDTMERHLSRHAHSIFMQTWFELGAVGAVLLAFAGVSILWCLQRFPAPVVPFAMGLFGSGALLSSVSYGMWQTWFIASFALAAALMAIAARAAHLAEDPIVRSPADRPH